MYVCDHMKKISFLIAIILSLYSCSPIKEQELLRHILRESSIDLNPDSLKTCIATASELWASKPWAQYYDKDIFINYILAPHIADEPVEYYWRTDIPKWLNLMSSKQTILTLAQQINDRIDVDTRPEDWGNKQMGYSATMAGKFGKCDDRAILAIMAMRSYGVPAAFDFIPMWASSNNGHSLCSVLIHNGTTLVFQNRGDKGTEYNFSHKVAKVYRKTFSKNLDCLIAKYQSRESIPPSLNDCRIKDVTSEHKIGQRDIRFSGNIVTENKLCYLSVFHPNGWFPIAVGEIHRNLMNFSAVGTGLDHKNQNPVKGDNIGDGILYLPCIYNGKVIPAGYAFILSKQGIKELIPSKEDETVILYRKFPRLARISRFAGHMYGGIIEGANEADFSDAIQLHRIYGKSLSHIQTIKTRQCPPCRYIRFRKPSGTFSLAELRAYNDNGQEIKGRPIASESMYGIEGLKHIYDNDPLTYFEVSPVLDIWAGIDFGSPQSISSIAFCPRNDDNDISPGDEYELFYWDNEWKTLGTKKATEYSIEFINVPKGALLWLRNRTKGKEERPFTYENGQQIWW